METSIEKKRLPAGRRFLIWLILIILAAAAPVSIVRSLMDRSHQTAVALAKQKTTLSKSKLRSGLASASGTLESAASRGIPSANLPLVGVYTGDDPEARKALEKQLEEISNLLRSLAGTSGIDCRVDGVLSFRSVLARMGVAVPETMTEADAAAEFLKHAQRYSALLAQWREAVGKGPWDFSALETKDSYTASIKIFNMSVTFQRLVGVMTEARLFTGDTDGAWSDLQIMNSSTIRNGDMLVSLGVFWLQPQMNETIQAGMKLGVWTDAQLLGISAMMGETSSLASMHRLIEGEKLWISDYLTRHRENQGQIRDDFSRSKSFIDQTINQIGITTVTDQQMADNLAVIHFQMDQPFTRFNPDTGFYLGESAGDDLQLPHSKPSDVSFDKFYYMYSEMYGGRHDWVPKEIIRSQSTIDQTRIAAALEIQRRATGQYPETLDALGDSIPRDIATGQPYLYQRNPDGGYTLWGTGIDRTSEGGDKRSDVPYVHRPLKR